MVKGGRCSGSPLSGHPFILYEKLISSLRACAAGHGLREEGSGGQCSHGQWFHWSK